MKVQGNSVSAAQPKVQTQQASPVSQAAQSTPGAQIAKQSQQGQPLTGKDEFVPGRKPDLGSVIGLPPKSGLGLGDRFTAAGLSDALSSPVNRIRLALSEKTETITRDPNGTYRGPEGQPLAQVKLKDGTTAYVDPNTNKYYLTDQQPDLFGRVKTLPAQDLPEGSQFSNSYFTDSEVKQVQQIAKDGSPLGPIKIPRDFPPYGPEFPKLEPLKSPLLGTVQG